MGLVEEAEVVANRVQQVPIARPVHYQEELAGLA